MVLPRSTSVTSTEALGTALPLGSVTLPMMFPKTACASDTPLQIKKINAPAKNRVHLRDRFKVITRLPPAHATRETFVPQVLPGTRRFMSGICATRATFVFVLVYRTGLCEHCEYDEYESAIRSKSSRGLETSIERNLEILPGSGQIRS